jgi:hypothetical protein
VTRATYVPTSWNPVSAGRPIRIQRVDRALARGAVDRPRLLDARRMVRLAVNGLEKSGRTTPGLRER